MDIMEAAKAVGMTVTSGLILFAANKFYAGAMLLINHEEKIKNLSDAVKVVIPNKIDDMENNILASHNSLEKTIVNEINPIKEKVGKIELDINALKVHTKYNQS